MAQTLYGLKLYGLVGSIANKLDVFLRDGSQLHIIIKTKKALFVRSFSLPIALGNVFQVQAKNTGSPNALSLSEAGPTTLA